MKRGLFLLAVVLLGTLPAAAQNCVLGTNCTAVSATVTDLNGLPYSQARVTATLVLTGGGPARLGTTDISATQQAVTLDDAGSFSLSLWDNAAVTPAGSQWRFDVSTAGVPVPFGFGARAFSVTLTITGASQSITANLNAAAAAQTRINSIIYPMVGGVDCAGKPGTDAGVKLQACHDALPATGGVMDMQGLTGDQFAAARVNITKSVLIRIGPNTTLRTTAADQGQNIGTLFNVTASFVVIAGAGWSSTLKKTGANNQQALISSDQYDNIALFNLKLDGDEANHTTTAGKYYTCWVANSTPVSHTLNLTLDTVDVTGCGNRAVDWRSPKRVHIRNSYFHQTGIATVGGTPLNGNATSLESENVAVQCEDVWVEDNTFEEWGDSAIGVGTCINPHVRGNTLKGRAFFGNVALTTESGIDGLGSTGGEFVGNTVLEVRGSSLAVTCYNPGTLFTPANTRIVGNFFYNVASLAAGDPRVVLGQGGVSCQPTDFVYSDNVHVGTRLSFAGISGFIGSGNSFRNIRSSAGGALFIAVDMGQGAGGVMENFVFTGNKFDTDNATLTHAFNLAAAITTPENSAFIGNVVGTAVTNRITYQAGAAVVPEQWPVQTNNSWLISPMQGTAILFSNLGTPPDGTFLYCSDCTIASPCAGGGTGALAKRLAGAWVCN